MTLSDIFDALSYGELSQYAIGSTDGGKIGPADYPRFAFLVNQGLQAIHQRLLLRTEQLLIQTTETRQFYNLTNQYAVSTTPATGNDTVDRYILDGENPFQNNIIMVVDVVRESGIPVEIDNPLLEDTVYLPRYNLLQFSQPKTEKVAVIYHATHPKLQVTRSTDIASVIIDLPDYCFDALVYFIGARFLSTSTDQVAIQTSQLFDAKFMNEINFIRQQGLINTSHFLERGSQWL